MKQLKQLVLLGVLFFPSTLRAEGAVGIEGLWTNGVFYSRPLGENSLMVGLGAWGGTMKLDAFAIYRLFLRERQPDGYLTFRFFVPDIALSQRHYDETFNSEEFGRARILRRFIFASLGPSMDIFFKSLFITAAFGLSYPLYSTYEVHSSDFEDISGVGARGTMGYLGYGRIGAGYAF